LRKKIFLNLIRVHHNDFLPDSGIEVNERKILGMGSNYQKTSDFFGKNDNDYINIITDSRQLFKEHGVITLNRMNARLILHAV
jgi:hypothetical protein